MKVGGNQEHAPNGLIGETVGDVLSLGSSRKAPNRANADVRRPGKALDVPLRKLNLHRIVNFCLRRNINYHPRSEPLVQKFQRMRGARSVSPANTTMTSEGSGESTTRI